MSGLLASVIVPPKTSRPSGLRGLLSEHAFELAVLWFFLLIGANLLIDPSATARSPIGEQLQHFPYVWAIAYVAGCTCAVAGLVLGDSRLRTVGLLAFGAGVTMHGVASVALAPEDLRSYGYLGVSLAATSRAVLVGHRAHRGED